MQIITTHLNADFDCLASMLAAKKIYPEARLVFPGSQEKNIRDFLKISELPLHFDKIKDIHLDEITQLILVDTSLTKRIGVFAQVIGRPGVTVHIYDHHPIDDKHPNKDIQGDMERIEEIGATTTIMLKILREKEITLSPEEATLLALGIYEDTGSFTFTTTTPADLEAGAYLRSCGADLNIVSDFLHRDLDADQINLLNELLHSLENYYINGVSLAITTATTEKYIGDIAVIAHKIKDMENLNILFVLVCMEDRIYLIGRSRVEAVDVGEIVAEFGGGGHSTASSAMIKALSLFEVKDKLLDILKKKIREIKIVREIMTTSIKFISSEGEIEEADKIMSRFDISSLPVLEKEKVIGIISREIVEKAMSHKMEKEKVKAFMTREFGCLYPDSPIFDVEKLVLENKQKLIPILSPETGSPVGVVSQGDLLIKYYGESLKKPQLLTQEQDQFPRFPFHKNVKDLVREKIPTPIREILNTLAETANSLNYGVYLVGGFVRDLLLQVKHLHFDLDIVVEGDGIILAQNLGQRLKARVRTHKKFTTAVVILPDGFKIDIATARIEYYKHPAALPTIEHSSLKNDLYRRDFTINALAIRLNGEEAFSLVDFFGGQRDLKEKTIKVLHSLSFVEDPTRVFRAIRFEQRFNFKIAPHTLNLLRHAIKKELFQRLSGKRLFTEIKAILNEGEPIKPIRRMADLDLLKFLHPQLKLDGQTYKILINIKEVIVWYKLLFLEKKAERWFVNFMGLVFNLTDQECEELCVRMHIPFYYREIFFHQRRMARQSIEALSESNVLPASRVNKILSGFSLEGLLFLMAEAPGQAIRKHISHYLTHLINLKVEITGEDLINIGIVPGPLFKTILEAVRDAKLNEEIKSKEEELGFVIRHYGKYLSPRSI